VIGAEWLLAWLLPVQTGKYQQADQACAAPLPGSPDAQCRPSLTAKFRWSSRISSEFRFGPARRWDAAVRRTQGPAAGRAGSKV